MGLLSHGFGAATTSTGPVVERGLRFVDDDSHRLSFTPTGASDREKFTWSFWIKRTALSPGSSTGVFNYNGGSNYIVFDEDDRLQITLYDEDGSGNLLQIRTLARFRDHSAWQHFCLSVDSTTPTVSLWINGVAHTNWDTGWAGDSGRPGTASEIVDGDFGWGTSGEIIYIGAGNGTGEPGDFLLADFYCLDGTLKTAADFGKTNSNGQWVPKETSFTSSDHGRAGVHLDFAGGHDSEFLLQSDHREGSTNFEDSSGAGHYGISTSGDPQHSIKVGSPFTGDDRAIYFDGSGDYIQDTGTTSQSDWEPGTGEFCYEVWYRSASSSGSASATQYLMMSPSDSSDVEYINLRVLTDGTIKSVVGWEAGGYNGDQLASVNVHDGRWHHIALVRDNSGTDDALHIYVDGKVKSTYDTSVGDIDNFADQGKLFTVGATHDGDTGYLHGYLFDFRATHGSRVYSGDFTPPTEKLSADSNTMLLIQPHKDDTSLGDESTENTKTITGYGDLSTVAPTASTPYAGVGEKSAIQFDASDRLIVPSSDDFKFGTGAFTIEFWIWTEYTGGSAQQFLGKYDGSTMWFGTYLVYGKPGLQLYGSGVSASYSTSSVADGEWHHVAFVRNSSELKIYIDGVSETLTGNTDGTSWDDLDFSNAQVVEVGGDSAGQNNWTEGYLFDVRITKGEAKDPTASGYLDAPFESTAVIHPGGDSGKRNHFDVVNLGMGDVVRDCPESGENYCTFNPLGAKAASTSSLNTLSEGNLQISGSNNYAGFAGTVGVTSGKWYCEFYCNQANYSGESELPMLGWGSAHSAYAGNGYDYTGGVLWEQNSGNLSTYTSDGSGGNDGEIGTGIAGQYDDGDIVGMAVDYDAQKVWYSVNGSWVKRDGEDSNPTATPDPNGFSIPSGENGTPQSVVVCGSGGFKITLNAGQDGSFAGNHTGTLVTGGGGEWAYAPPTGFKALKTEHLTPSTNVDDYFKTVTYTGSGSSGHEIDGVGFQPDLVIIKNRDGGDGYVFDSTRDVHKYFQLYGASVYDDSTTLTSFDNDGFTLGDSSDMNSSSTQYVAWCFKKDASAGLDIVSYAGNGSSTRDISHSLGSTPKFVWVQQLSGGTYSACWHEGLSGGDYYFNNQYSESQDSSVFRAAPTSSVIKMGDSSYTNYDGDDYIMYVWGGDIFKTGKYAGNSSSDGPFAFCGGQPRFLTVMTRNTTNSWPAFDTVREGYNPMNDYLQLGNTDPESAGDILDLISNGFKPTASNTQFNETGYDYCWLAAVQPLKNSNAR